MGTKSYRSDIQGLRGVAILLVVLLHSGIPGFEGGFVGVDLFLVLSGYVVTESALRKPRGPYLANVGSFLHRRIIRIVPNMTVVIIATVLGSYFLLGPAFNDDLLKDATWSSFFAENLRLINIGANYFIAGLDKSLLNHLWFLGIEQQIYLVFPLVLFAFWKMRNRLPLAATLFAAIVASSLCSAYLTEVDATSAYYSPLSRAWEIALGSLTALIPPAVAQRAPKTLNTLLAGVGLTLVLFSAFTLNSRTAYPGLIAWVPVAGAALLLWANENSHAFGTVSWLSWRPLRYLGDISYSLYLWHFVWLTLPMQLPVPLVGLGWTMLETLGAVACAVLSYHFIEQKLRGNERLNDPIVGLLVLLIAVAAVWNATLVVRLMQAIW